eukprot:2098031-Prymnesium_polylepis.1
MAANDADWYGARVAAAGGTGSALIANRLCAVTACWWRWARSLASDAAERVAEGSTQSRSPRVPLGGRCAASRTSNSHESCD